MTLKKSTILEKESEYEKSNKDINSVCKGFFYISNRKENERCKNCDTCSKYKRYSSKKEDSVEVRFHYVDTFRKCVLYKQKDNRDFYKVFSRLDRYNKVTEMFPINHGSIKRAYSTTANIERHKAYKRMVNNEESSKVQMECTYAEIFALEIMFMVIEDMNDAVRLSSIFQHQVKQSYNKFNEIYGRFKKAMINTCYYKDRDALKDEVERVYPDVMKFRITLENYINRWKVRDSYAMSFVLVADEIVHLVYKIHNDNNSMIQKFESNLRLEDFLCPTILIKPLNNLSLQMSNILVDKDTVINLRECNDLKIGLKVIENRVRDRQRIANILTSMYRIHGKEGNIVADGRVGQSS